MGLIVAAGLPATVAAGLSKADSGSRVTVGVSGSSVSREMSRRVGKRVQVRSGRVQRARGAVLRTRVGARVKAPLAAVFSTVGPSLVIRARGRVAGSMMVEIPVGALPVARQVMGGLRVGGSWRILPARYNRATGVVSISVPVGSRASATALEAREAGLGHLWSATVSVLTDLPQRARDDLIRPVVNEIASGAVVLAKVPQCTRDPAGAWTMQASGLQRHVIGCMDLADDGALLMRLANTSRYVVLVSSSEQVQLAEADTGDLATQISTWLGPNHQWALAPGDSMVLRVPPGTSTAKIRVRYDGFAQAVNAVFVATDVLATVLSRKSGTKQTQKEIKKQAEELRTRIHMVGCLTKILNISPSAPMLEISPLTLTKFVRSCLTDEALRDVFGSGAALLAGPIVTTISTATYFLGAIQGVTRDPWTVAIASRNSLDSAHPGVGGSPPGFPDDGTPRDPPSEGGDDGGVPGALGAPRLELVDSPEVPYDGEVAVSADGCKVAFTADVFDGIANPIYLRDVCAHETKLAIRVDDRPVSCIGGTGPVSMSRYGRYVAYSQCAGNIVQGVYSPPFSHENVYVTDTTTGRNWFVPGIEVGLISLDGRFVVGASPDGAQVIEWDRLSETSSVLWSRTAADAVDRALYPTAISSGGRWTLSVAMDGGVFLHDRDQKTTVAVAVPNDCVSTRGVASQDLALLLVQCADGTYVLDTKTGQSTRALASTPVSGLPPEYTHCYLKFVPSISPDGRFVAQGRMCVGAGVGPEAGSSEIGEVVTVDLMTGVTKAVRLPPDKCAGGTGLAGWPWSRPLSAGGRAIALYCLAGAGGGRLSIAVQ